MIKYVNHDFFGSAVECKYIIWAPGNTTGNKLISYQSLPEVYKSALVLDNGLELTWRQFL